MDLRATAPVTGKGEKPGALRQRDVRRRFELAAATFDDADFVHRHAARGIVERLSPMLVDVQRVLDAGAGPGRASRELAKLYHRSQVVSIDHSIAMLRLAKKGRSRFARVSEVQADAVALPLQSGSIDLVFANLLLPWVDDIGQFFSAVDRVLRKDGLFVFSSLGPDSLAELRQAWAGVDDGEHVNTFIDMHDIGDALLKCGLREPVLDVDFLTVTYRDADALISDLTLAGGRNCLSRRRRTLTGKNRFARMKQALNASCNEGVLACRLELVYGHAWGGGPRESPGEFRVDASSVSRRRR
jgi:malonyl-CoA O-methyltransferase